MVERFMAMSGGEEISAAEVRVHLSMETAAAEPDGTWPCLEEVERHYIAKVLHRTGGNRALTARILGIDPKTLYNKLRAERRTRS